MNVGSSRPFYTCNSFGTKIEKAKQVESEPEPSTPILEGWRDSKASYIGDNLVENRLTNKFSALYLQPRDTEQKISSEV